ncbi:CvpA family protein [Corticibacter populi]|uniref:CvpA family protein n=1 Tax=Corticibacter populi TaxID=1550736 RepID=A0A3M6QYC4_9BURK|nr:CvpA family protein [Corticibacter populi]RMX08007.1 CvpA family protein [Corticibacter populi]RZS35250.1 membrane protein required for colicin V production [Corticibacter populi]
MVLSWFDVFFLMLAALSVAFGAWRGFVFESISVLGWIAGFFAAMQWGPQLGLWLPGEALAEEARRALGMLAVFVLAVFLSSMLASLARASVQALGMRAADRVIGAGFGLLRIVLLGVALTVVLHVLQWQDAPWWRESALAGPLDTARLELARMLPNWKVLQPVPPVELPPALEAGRQLL